MRITIKNSLKYISLLMILLLLIFFCRSCASSFGYEDEEVYTSPQGTNTIVVKYDFVCRPDVFKKGWLWEKKIWSYPNSGFMESVHFGVEWLSENQIRLEYDDVNNDEYDEEYIITIPD
ncbi:MAG: hypothetical protein HFI70_04160 [Lachnospiraceae bacterium]|nr:hypothetical protein [Lachnospiraceae bacterium]